MGVNYGLLFYLLKFLHETYRGSPGSWWRLMLSHNSWIYTSLLSWDRDDRGSYKKSIESISTLSIITSGPSKTWLYKRGNNFWVHFLGLSLSKILIFFIPDDKCFLRYRFFILTFKDWNDKLVTNTMAHERLTSITTNFKVRKSIIISAVLYWLLFKINELNRG